MPEDDANDLKVGLNELDQGMNGNLENNKIKKWNNYTINCLMTIFVLVAILITVSSVQKTSSHLAKDVSQLQKQSIIRIDTLLKSRRSNVMTVMTPSNNSEKFFDITQCFKKGNCRLPYGQLLKYYNTDNVSVCMAHCISNDECQWTSFYYKIDFCILLSSCPTIDVDHDHLQKSISSRTNCPLEIPCNISGRCEGPVHKYQITKHQCHLTCEENDLCNWYSFGENVCIMFSTCINVDVSQNNFTTQHSSCPELIGNTMEAYEKRYDHIRASGWSPFILKSFTECPEVDCRLYCEEYDWCDFFVHRIIPISKSLKLELLCYLGTFGQPLAYHTDHNLTGLLYFVDKNASLPILHERFEENGFPVDASLIGDYFVYKTILANHSDTCPLACILDAKCLYYFMIDTPKANCFLGNFKEKDSLEEAMIRFRGYDFVTARKFRQINYDILRFIPQTFVRLMTKEKGLNITSSIVDAIFNYQEHRTWLPNPDIRLRRINLPYGLCQGAKLHMVTHDLNQNWTLSISLIFADPPTLMPYGVTCLFTIFKLVEGKMKLTISDFNAGTSDYLIFNKGPGIAEPFHSFSGNQRMVEYEWTATLVTIEWKPQSYRREAKNPINGTITIFPDSDNE